MQALLGQSCSADEGLDTAIEIARAVVVQFGKHLEQLEKWDVMTNAAF
jgi:hypothetical protein